ncbi:probable NADH dehydrogenase [ubiquinone] 1 alpha subcomplex subunit 12 [Solanum dulcamara]|uniref:probable NADH dehydrogenase [ubiquinone] 1 alpha subcomplex subunit 12 n=1 Tax=Solanum dulcamara TaxID=45834 RepID=UPI002485B56A|nr:probable NADH dehydrogenase [ubiquinone] 1 alpha subcomplex subunit 12 [Solanum dulcamara]
MAWLLRSIFQSIKEKGIGNFLKELREDGYLRCLADGNLLRAKIYSKGGILAGVDKFGNKYYEKLGDTQYGWYSCFMLSCVLISLPCTSHLSLSCLIRVPLNVSSRLWVPLSIS